MNGARQQARPTAIAPMESGFAIRNSPLTNLKEDKTGGKTAYHRSRGNCPRESGAKHGNRNQMPGIARRSQTHPGWGLHECGVVAESAEPEGPAPALPPFRSDGQGVQLCRRI